MKLRIKEISKEQGLQMKDLAEKLGITQTGLGKIANGATTIKTLEKVATALNVPITELFESESSIIVCPHCKKKIQIEIKPAE